MANSTIKTRIVKIGNSQGIRIPKTLLEQSGIDTEVELQIEGDTLIIRKATKKRSGWDAAFSVMAEQPDDARLDELTETDWERTEWEW
jgi:antitoxin MazE